MALKKKASKKIVTPNDVKEDIVSLDYTDEMKQSYLDYAVSVLSERALADVRDGLKPVQRRVLYAMDELGLSPTSPFKKSARIVGDTMGKYHPHGDCLDANTLVPLLSGEYKTIEELYNEGESQYVYAIDTKTNKIVPTIAHDFRIGQYATDIYNIELSTGKTIKVTSNHPFRLTNGSWVKAEDLKENMILDSAGYSGGKVFKDKELLVSVNKIVIDYLPNPIPMYDFTVDGYENMLICANDEQNVLITVHNSSIYGSLVTMSKDWMYPYPLVEGHGNFGSIEGDGEAAMRYTESRLSKMSKSYFFGDIDKDTVDFVPNFDETEKEPKLLPVQVPNLLISGSEGIACGMAASIPSHNASETIDAVLAYMKKESISIEKLMEYIQGPDFATGGVIANKKDLLDIYSTGNGKIRVRGKLHVEEGPNSRPLIVITEIPQTMVGAIDKFMESVADLVRTKKAPDITDIANMSSKEGIRIVIELKKDANPQKTINLLYKKTKLEDTFGVNMLAVKDAIPHVYNLKEFIAEFVAFQYEINTRKYNFLLAKEEKFLEIKQGLLKACDCIDLIIEIVRGSKTKTVAKDCLVKGRTDGIAFKTAKAKKEASKLNFTEAQANAILSMQLQSLIGLEIQALKQEIAKAEKRQAEYSGYLADKSKMKKKIESDLKSAKEVLASPRRTEIIDAEEIVLEKEEEVVEDCVLLIDRFGYVKMVSSDTYERNKDSADKEFKYIFKTNTADKLFIFADSGTKYQIKCSALSMVKYKEKGTPLEVLSKLTSNERPILIDLESSISKQKLFFLSDDGLCKIVSGTEFVCTTSATVATKFKEKNTKLISVVPILSGMSDVVMITKEKQALRFSLSEVSEMKKNSAGMSGIKLKGDDKVLLCSLGTTKSNIVIDDKEVSFAKIKKQKRASAGNKL